MFPGLKLTVSALECLHKLVPTTHGRCGRLLVDCVDITRGLGFFISLALAEGLV